MDANPVFPNRDVGQLRIDPAARVVVIHSVARLVQGLMRVAAKNPIRVMLARIFQRASGDL